MEPKSEKTPCLNWTREGQRWVSSIATVAGLGGVRYSIGGYGVENQYVTLYLHRHVGLERILVKDNLNDRIDAEEAAETDLEELISKYVLRLPKTELHPKELRWIIRSCDMRHSHVFVDGEYGPHKFTASLPTKQGETVLATLTHEFKSEGTDLTQALKNALDQAKEIYNA